MTLTDYMCQEKKEKEGLPALKTVLTHQYNDLHTKAWRKTDYSHQKQYCQYEEQQNDNNKTTITRKQKSEGKRLYRRFKWLTSDISLEKT